jgi:PAS domain S-box-containing protein
MHEQFELEKGFRCLADNLPDSVVRWDAAGRLGYSNRSHERAVGRPTAEMLGRTTLESFPDGRFVPVYEAILQIAATGSSMEFARLPVPLENGEIRIHDLKLVPEFDADGRVCNVLGIGRDMTEFYRMQDAVTEREQEFRALVENTPDVVARYDSTCRRLYVNPAFARLVGLPKEELVGRRPADYGGSPLAADYERALRYALDTGEEVEHELIWFGGDGRLRNTHFRLVPERDGNGAVASVLAVGRDISAIREAERRLAESERQFRMLAENLPESVVRYDTHCRRLYMNRSLTGISDVSLRQPSGGSPSVHSPVHREYAACLKQVIASGESGEVHLDVVDDLTGNPRHYQVVMVAERDELGEIVGALAIARDVSEFREVQVGLERSQAQIRALAARSEDAREEERRHIAREVHDELGQLLTGLQLSVARIERKFGDAAPGLREHLSETQGLVEMALAAARSIASALRPVALDMGVCAAIEWLSGEFEKRTGIECTVRFAKCGSACGDRHAVGFYRIAQEALTNVTRHAGAAHVSLALENDGEACVLTVKDDGRGFDPHAVRPGALGLLGIGERALMLGGTVTVDSAPGFGTEVRVRVPSASQCLHR